MSERAKGLIAVSLQTAIAISGYFIGKEALHAIPVAPLVLMRSLSAALLLLGVAAMIPRDASFRPRKGDFWRVAGLGIAGVPLNQALFLWGLSKTTAAHAALLYSLTPAIVMVIGVRRGTERATRARAIGIAMAILGVVLVLFDASLHGAVAAGGATVAAAGPVAAHVAGATQGMAHMSASTVSHQSGKQPLLGDLILLCAVLSWASYTAFSRGVVERLGAVRATAWALAIGAVIFAPIGGFFWWRIGWLPVGVPAAAWFGLVWLVLMSSMLAYLCWYYAIRRLDPSSVAVFNNLQPIGTAFGQWVVFGIALGPAFVVGGALAVAGVVTAQRGRFAKPPAGE